MADTTRARAQVTTRDVIYIVTLALTSAANYGATRAEIAATRDEVRVVQSAVDRLDERVYQLARSSRASVASALFGPLPAPCPPDASRVVLTTSRGDTP